MAATVTSPALWFPEVFTLGLAPRRVGGQFQVPRTGFAFHLMWFEFCFRRSTVKDGSMLAARRPALPTVVML